MHSSRRLSSLCTSAIHITAPSYDVAEQGKKSVQFARGSMVGLDDGKGEGRALGTELGGKLGNADG